MKVKELIEALSKFPQDYDVRICSTNSSYYKHGHIIDGLLEDVEKVEINRGYVYEEVIITN